jgi:adenosylmethionine-8-amino-7-oxononanoate aminotransferase
MSTHKHPHGHVFYRRMAHDHPLIVRGEGVYLYDSEGKSYLDGSGGALVANLGHGVAGIAQAMAEQASQAAYIHATMFTSEAIERYSESLAGIVPIPEAKFYFLSSGSEAVEGALKLARQIQVERGQPARHLVISRWQSYHGVTLGALAVTGKPKMRTLYSPMLRDMPHIPSPYCYRCPYELEHPGCQVRCAEALEEEIKCQGEGNVAAFIAEPVSGATLGGAVPPPDYWPRIKQICDRYNVLVIADEVLTGMGRTGKWFAVEHWDIQPDILTIGKGATGGYFPLAVLAARGELVDLIFESAGNFNHGGTFSHHAVGAAAGQAALELLQDGDLAAGVEEKGAYLEKALRASLSELGCVGDIRGMGLMWGVELVEDRETKRPFDSQKHVAQKVADEAFHNGLILYPGSGCVDGIAGDHFTIGPPFTITNEEIDKLVQITYASIQAVMNSLND